MLSIGVLFVDVQKDFINPDGALYVSGAEKIKNELISTMKTAIKYNIDIAFTVDVHDGSESEMIENGGQFPKHCMSGTDGVEIIDELINILPEKYSIFSKSCYDIFDKECGSKDIYSWAEDKNMIYICGVATDYCVKAAVLGILNNKLCNSVFVVSNAICGINKETTEKAIVEMKTAGAMFTKLYFKEYDK